MSKLVELGSICSINPTLRVAPESLCSFVPMEAVNEHTGQIEALQTRVVSEVAKGYTPFEENDVLFAKITPCMENGKGAIARGLTNGVGYGSTEFHILRAEEQTKPEWIFYFLRQKSVRAECERRMTGSAGQKRVSTSALQDLPIPLPALPEQQRIAATLERADHLRRTRRFARQMSETFLQSVFLKMFGDPVSNPMGDTVVRLMDVATRITDGVHQKPNYTDTGVPFISVKDITTGKLLFNDCKRISVEDHERFTKRCKPERLDILYTKVGATYGRPVIVNTNREFSIYVSVCLIKPRKEIIDPYFLHAAMATSAVKSQADNRIKGIGVPDLHLDQIQNFLIPLPSMAEQRKFATVVQRFERLRAGQIETERQAEHLFQTLLHRAFAPS